MKKGSETKTLSLRLEKGRAEEIEQAAELKGYPSTSAYLVAIIDLLGPLVKSPREQANQLCQSNPVAVADSAK